MKRKRKYDFGIANIRLLEKEAAYLIDDMRGNTLGAPLRTTASNRVSVFKERLTEDGLPYPTAHYA